MEAKEFMKLPLKEKRRLLAEQAKDPDIIAYYKELFEPKGEKPPVLDKEVMEEAAKVKGLYYTGGTEYLERLISFGIKRCEAQRDADVAHYEPIIQQAKDKGWEDGYTAGVLNGDRRTQKAIQQAKAEVAREIIEKARKEVKFSLRRQLIKFPSTKEQEAVAKDLVDSLNTYDKEKMR